jgi:DNA-binding CsgD family transcriptional regulator
VTDVEQGRAAFAQRAWAEAYSALAAADDEVPLGLADLERLAVAACLVGRDQESVTAWTRAYRTALGNDDLEGAVRHGFWLAFGLLNRGEVARGSGWVDKLARLIGGGDTVEHGYVSYVAALRGIFRGDVEAAHAAFARAAAIGDRFDDPVLTSLARVGEGRCLVYSGELTRGVALLDEAMVSVVADEVSPVAVGDVYCTVIDACQELFDIRRVREWTDALSNWCDSQPDLVLYRGQCLIHRAELMQLRGSWSDAVTEVERACARLADPPGQAAIGAAHYVRGELLRARGELERAEEAYREANRFGRDPQPGLALLRVAQGRPGTAAAATRRALDVAGDPISRARLLPAHVEILLAEGDVSEARVAVSELADISGMFDSAYLRARTQSADGAVRLAEGDISGAVGVLGRASAAWQELDTPYELGRARVLMAEACRRLGDDDTWQMELDHVEELSGSGPATNRGVLSPRESEVLALVAAGRTNRLIAEELVISEKTVARHVSNIFTKLDVSSRSAATAYAYRNGLVPDSST